MGVAHQVRHLVDEAGELVVELLDRSAPHPQHRVWVLADLRERDADGVRVLRVELSLVRHLVAVVFRESAALRRHGASLERLRVDVDDGRHTGAPHRRRGRSEQLAGPRRQRARLIGLRDELRPVAAAEPQQRRRPEQSRAGQLRVQLAEQSRRPVGVGAGGDDRDQMAEGRVAELTPSLELLGEEPATSWRAA